MATRWERNWFSHPVLDRVELHHSVCGKPFRPEMRCDHCHEEVRLEDASYRPGPGATRDLRETKVRRRSSISTSQIPSERALYRNLINLVGDRWTANIIALSFHGITRFDAFHRELPVATNILSDRLRLLVEEGVFEQHVYQERPRRMEYRLTEKGRDLFPWVLALLQWGDTWCDPEGRGRPMLVVHERCGELLGASARCSECGGHLLAHEVEFTLDGEALRA